ncbi:glycosyltransferase family 4 protein [Carnobacteriaceae bacterium 52-44]
MNVFHVNSNYLTSKLHENLIDKLESKKLHNTIYMPMKKEKRNEFLFESKHDLHTPIAFNHVDRYVFHYKQKKIRENLKELFNPNNFDVVHAHTLFTDGYVAYRLKEKYNIPYIVTVRGGTDIHVFFKRMFHLRNTGKKILKNADQIIFLSEVTRTKLVDEFIKNRELKQNILGKSQIIPNGIDDFWFKNAGKQKKIENTQKLKIISVGKKLKKKNFIGTIQALNYLKNEYNIESYLEAIGKTYEESYIKQMHLDAEIPVENISAISREELIGHYRENDIFVLPSFSETFGLVYPEAMSQGLPVIYSANEGFHKQFAEGEIGYAVNPNDPEDIANKILLILKNYESISENTLQAYKKFNWENLANRYVSIYNHVKRN